MRGRWMEAAANPWEAPMAECGRGTAVLGLLLVLAGCATSGVPGSAGGDWPWRQSFCPALSEAVRRVRDDFGSLRGAPAAMPGGADCAVGVAAGTPSYGCAWTIRPDRRDAAVSAMSGDVRGCLEDMVTATSPQSGGQSLRLDGGMDIGIGTTAQALTLSLTPPVRR